jgi:hypothetical protein
MEEPEPSIRFEILEGNPGGVMPDRGMIYFSRCQEAGRPAELIDVNAEYAGEIAINHYLYEKDLDDIESNEFDVIGYFYECDVLNLEGPDKRLDRHQLFRENVSITGFKEFTITRDAEKYPLYKLSFDRFTLCLIAPGNNFQNIITLNKFQVSLILRELEAGIADFEKGDLKSRSEANRMNQLVWLGQDMEIKDIARPYLVLYFNGARFNLLINFGTIAEAKVLKEVLQRAYDAW